MTVMIDPVVWLAGARAGLLSKGDSPMTKMLRLR